MLQGVKINEPYVLKDIGHGYECQVWYVDDNMTWRYHPSSWYKALCDLDGTALKNRRDLYRANKEYFHDLANIATADDIMGSDRGGILLHMRAAMLHVTEGMTFDEFVKGPLEGGSWTAWWRYDPIMRCATFNKTAVQFVRSPENPNKKTFDYIHVPIGISGCKDKLDFVKNNYKGIAHEAIKMLSEYKRFTKYGVPVNVLKVEKAVLTHQGELILTFGLKEIKIDDEKKGEAVREQVEA